MTDLSATIARVLEVAERRRRILAALHDAIDRGDWRTVVAVSRELRGIDAQRETQARERGA